MSTPSTPGSARGAGITRAPFGTAPGGGRAEVFTLTNARGMAVRFTDYGGIILSVAVPDRNGALADVTLGYDSMEGYAADTRYFGALIGRYANRIAGGRFALDGRDYPLATNNGPNHLHGGRRGFNAVMWTVEPFEGSAGVGAVLRYRSADGEEGYPGALDVRVTYTLTGANALIVDYRATASRATPVNLTQHAYVNLAGHDAGDIMEHELTLAARRFTPADHTLIPTGELRGVRGTPFDFTTPTAIGARIDADDDQLRHGRGYDHNFVLDRAESRPEGSATAPVARLYEPRSGRVLEIHTTEPGIQLYSGNVLEGGPVGKGGHVYRRREGLALETQHFPDSPNQPDFPSTILRPGSEYASRTVYRFSTADRL
ncbi:MAG: aldose epimerase family protein [Gemmatimonadaceae bacterium]